MDKELGSGTFGRVLQHPQFPNQAIKRFHSLNQTDGSGPYELLREVAILQHMKSRRNIVQIVEEPSEEAPLQFTMEKYDMDLDRFIRISSHLDWKAVLHQLLIAVADCHAHRITHRDICTSNILVNTKSGSLALSDFSCARRQEPAFPRSTSPTGGRYVYQSPESLLQHCKDRYAADL